MKKQKLLMKRNNFLVKFSIFCIKKICQEHIVLKYGRKYNIICRFHPNCSNYGILSLEKDGFVGGWKKTIGRIKRCRIYNFDSCVDFP